jgi:glutamine synthetase
VLKEQIARAATLGLTPMMATELEFFIFRKPLDQMRAEGYSDLTPLGPYNEDYHILQTTKEEHVLRPVRNHLVAAGIPVENTKGEAEAGQEELNIRYAEALLCADHHTIGKQAVKEIAWQQGHSATFLPKWHRDRVGSASHVHMSMWKDGVNTFHDAGADHGMSEMMHHFIAGLIAYAPDCTFFMAPYINSYKRFAKGTFAPTKAAWSVDNRTAGFRLCGEGTKGVRIESRIPGSDINPYLAQAALLAAGLKGIENALPAVPAIKGDLYEDDSLQDIPTTLRDATETLRGSAMLREAMGDDVIDHYTRCAEWEQEEFDRTVTDWEIARGFEKA